MSKSAVTGTRGADALLRSRGRSHLDVKDAVAEGVIYGEKVEGIWAYGADQRSIQNAREGLAQAVQHLCKEWLLVTSPIAASAGRKRVKSVDIELSVTHALIREMIRTEQLGCLPLLTEDYLPYFSVYSFDDQDEIDRFIATMHSWTVEGGEYGPHDLPEPLRRRSIEAWRDRVLAHGEFLGLGGYEDRTLFAYGFAL